MKIKSKLTLLVDITVGIMFITLVLTLIHLQTMVK